MQVAALVLDAFSAPDVILQIVLILLMLGFPVAIALAWVFDIGPDGTLERTSTLDEQPPVQEDAGSRAEELPEVSLAVGDSQRRQVSMLSCLFEMLTDEEQEVDPEAFIETLRDLQQAAKEIANRYNAYEVPSGTGSVGLVFGYPHARDNDARRALAAGLALIDEARKWRERHGNEERARFSVRIGVATGVVVVNERDDDESDVEFIGQTPRVASWIRDQAPPDALVIGPQTFRLVESQFKTEPLQSYERTPFGENVTLYCVREAILSHDMLQQELPLAGRDDELRLLTERWDSVVDGEGQFVLITGPAGIGKSSLVRSFYQRAVHGKGARVLLGQCAAHEDHTPLSPLIDLFQRQILDFSGLDSAESRFDEVRDFLRSLGMDGAESASLLAGMLSLDAGEESKPPSGSAEYLRMRTLELVLQVFTGIAQQQPVLLIFEDIHWADPSTLEMIQMLIDHGPAPGLLVLFSARPEFKADWTSRSFVLVRELHALARKEARGLVQSIDGANDLPGALVDRIVDETDGNPLYIQELTRSLVESDQWRAEGSIDDTTTTSLVIPATLQDSLTARMDDLGEAKALLQLCSVLGREFSYAMIRAVSATENEAALKEKLEKLVRTDFLFQRGVLENQTFTFKHILILETAYNSLLKSKRRELHGRMAEILEREVPDAARRQPALLAYHYTEAGDPARAIPYWTLASRQSAERFANQEAIQQSRRGIELLETLPDTLESAAQEIPLQAVLGSALLPIRGYAHAEVRKVFSRALELCEKLGDAPELFRVAVGLWMYYAVAGEYGSALELGQRLLRIAETTLDPAQYSQARYCLAFVLYYRGEPLAAKSHLEAAVESEVEGCDYTTQSPGRDDTRVHVRVMLALVNWFLGYPKTGERLLQQAASITHEKDHPWSIAFGGFMTAWFYQLRLDPGKTLEFASEAAAASEENGFRFWLLLSNYLEAWAKSRDPQSPDKPIDAEGPAQMLACMEKYRGIGSRVGLTSLYLGLAEEYISLQMTEQAKSLLEAGIEERQRTGESFFEAEYFRLHGELHASAFRRSGERDEMDRAISFFERALAEARRRGSRSFELRAAVSLAESLASKENYEPAAQILGDVVRQYEEMDDSPYCVRATRLLQRLEAVLEGVE